MGFFGLFFCYLFFVFYSRINRLRHPRLLDYNQQSSLYSVLLVDAFLATGQYVSLKHKWKCVCLGRHTAVSEAHWSKMCLFSHMSNTSEYMDTLLTFHCSGQTSLRLYNIWGWISALQIMKSMNGAFCFQKYSELILNEIRNHSETDTKSMFFIKILKRTLKFRSWLYK